MIWWKILQAACVGFYSHKAARPPVGGRSQPSLERIVLLLITQDDSLRHSLFALGHVYRWEVISVPTLDEAIAVLTERQIPLVICDEEASEDWRKTVRSIAFLPQSTCILLASPASRDSLLREVDRHHGYDVIAKPLRFEEVADRVSFAWTWYKSGRASWWGPPRTSALLPPYRGAGG
jgi:DNA-binding response OmpR family regulator